MPIPIDKHLYEQAKKEADNIYSKPSAYKSGYIVKKYKSLGGRYKEDGKERNLERWYLENWSDIGGMDYPVFRPTKRINKKTPLTQREIDNNNLHKQILLKQTLKGEYNLPPFLKKIG